MDALPRSNDPAFPGKLPRQDTRGEEAADFIFFGGITVRDWFAAHAPTEIPRWFQYQPSTPRPELPDKYKELDDKQRRELEAGDGWPEEGEASDEVVAFANRMRVAHEAQERWERKRDADRFIAWRWHYADLMIRGREGS